MPETEGKKGTSVKIKINCARDRGEEGYLGHKSLRQRVKWGRGLIGACGEFINGFYFMRTIGSTISAKVPTRYLRAVVAVLIFVSGFKLF